MTFMVVAQDEGNSIPVAAAPIPSTLCQGFNYTLAIYLHLAVLVRTMTWPYKPAFSLTGLTSNCQ